MVIKGSIVSCRGLYVEITDQVKGAEEGSQGKKTETDNTRPKEILHGKSITLLPEKVSKRDIWIMILMRNEGGRVEHLETQQGFQMFPVSFALIFLPDKRIPLQSLAR
jgi:hypothetical protein